ncbi:chromatin assembly factor 1 subunit A-domain-containing protein [Lipomyces japonicus]|uniref:chromatin assembly factor 1 subunit A-domain-containing protein n=1 Tax=Lipomyces japonicus TaxID=56871 RepID=UPI0034CFE07C
MEVMDVPTPGSIIEIGSDDNVVEISDLEETVSVSNVEINSETTDLAVNISQPGNELAGTKRKKKKLTEDEKVAREQQRLKRLKEIENKKIEKIAREADREEKKKLKEKEKKLKDEEKKKKDEEKKKRDEDKRKKEEEIKANDRKQLRLGNFFKKTTPTASIAPPIIEAESIVAQTEQINQKNSLDFNDVFLPFHVKANATLFPQNRFCQDQISVEHARSHLDELFQTGEYHSNKIIHPQLANEVPNFAEIFQLSSNQRRPRGKRLKHSTKDVIAMFNNADNQFTSTSPAILSEDKLRAKLNGLPKKFLRFFEDLRPPYFGTFTKTCSIPRANPFCKIPLLNYEYDSEAEWVQEEEDGDDLDNISEEEEDEEDDDDESKSGDFIDDEMKDFLVDEDEEKPKRRVLTALVPVMKGICYTNLETGLNPEFDGLGMEIATIQPSIQLPIDPFKDYWITKPSSEFSTGKHSIVSSNQKTGFSSQRPLPERIPQLELKQLLQQIQGSDLNKLMLIETLKKKFKSISKENIRITVGEVAKRVGDKEVDKRWVIDPEIWQQYVSK